MEIYGGLAKEKVLEIYEFVMQNRKETGFGQRKLFRIVKEKFGVEIKESTISGWIFRKIVPYSNEKTQFKAKPMPEKDELYKFYIDQKLSAERLGKRYGVSTIIVINWLRAYGIVTRTHLESMNTENIKKELSEQKLKLPTKDYSHLGPEKAYILGVLCGDGHITETFLGLEIRHDEDFIEEFTKCFEKIYGLKYNYKYCSPKNTLYVRISNQTMCKDLLSYGKFRTREWRTPKEIMRTNDKKIIGAFLRGFYDSEGSSSSRSCVTCSSVNKGGLMEIGKLLEKLGIKSTLRGQRNNSYYVLYIFRKERFKLFRDLVGFTIKRKRDKLNDTINTGFFSKRSVA